MGFILEESNIPSDAGIAIEFVVPLTSSRIDFIISGFDEKDERVVIIIELKQWDYAEKVLYKDGVVRTHFRGRITETAHPSYQAWSYKMFIKDFNSSVHEKKIQLQPCAYLHNYDKEQEDELKNSHYAYYLKQAPVFLRQDRLDLSKEGFFYPTTLLPLGIRAKQSGKVVILPKNADVANYVSIIIAPRLPGLLYSKSYMPIISFPKEPSKFDPIFTAVVEICEKGRDLGGGNAFRYFLGELSQNVYDHANFEHAYLMVQRYSKRGFVEIVIVDDGITVPGSYEKNGVTGQEDNELLWRALNGDSTKTGLERGFGLGTSVKLLT